MQEIHYQSNQEEQRRKYKSSGNFRDAALCGHGSPLIYGHAKGTRNISAVTCEACKRKLGRV